MKLNINKKQLKNLSKDAEKLPEDLTPQVGGGTSAVDCIGGNHTFSACGTWRDCADTRRGCQTDACASRMCTIA